ncbi:BgtE-5839 [Blumeria graminis f. sp. tritici]|uniref:BgtE-5839 n=2 Tax=Blumeria graminis f. sp. tritici TaxID=62690 RepID=A0A9X9L891_BLUGR|nr:BgtE-5839 [Blumeria graminis f. sp. tritici]
MKFLCSASLMSLFTLALSKCKYVCPGGYEITEEKLLVVTDKVDRNPKKKHDTIWKTETSIHVMFDLEKTKINNTEYLITGQIYTPKNITWLYETEIETGKKSYCDIIEVNEEDELSYDESFEAELSDDESEEKDLSDDEFEEKDLSDDESEEDLSELKSKTN